jgi:hypothetical protein
MAITLNDNLQIQAGKHIDNRYGPYGSLTTTLSTLSAFQRSMGLTVGVMEAGSVKEYWFKSGVTNSDLVEKTTSQLQYKTEYYGNSAIYVGTARTGSSESSNIWTIKKSIFSSAGTFTSSVSALNIAWTNRYNL